MATMNGKLRIVPFAVTEEAIRLVRLTHADFRRHTPRLPRGRLRATTTPNFGIYDFEQVGSQSEYLRVVSIVEAFVDATSARLFDIKAYGLPNFVTLMADDISERASNTWDERKTAFKTYHSVTLGNCAKYSDIDGAVVVRNSVAHGLGSLTRRQRNPRDRGKVTGVGVRIVGNQLVIDGAAVDRLAMSACLFIADVDRRLPR